MNILMTLNHSLPMNIILNHAAKVFTIATLFACFLHLCYNKSKVPFKMLPKATGRFAN